MTFKRWIYNYIDEDSPTGDLARDIYQDPTYPDSHSYYDNNEYLIFKSASYQCLESFENAWEIYKSKY